MRNIRKCLGLGLLSLALAASGPACAMAGQAGPGAAYKPSVNGISIYVSKKGNTVTQQGDGITPSGKFYVCTKNDQSQYYLSLGLSYPGIEDAERGLADGLINEEQYKAIVDANKAGEQPPWDTPLGGAIMIHGEQGGGTAGCIAVTNDVMDILWEYCNLGVPVTVGP